MENECMDQCCKNNIENPLISYIQYTLYIHAVNFHTILSVKPYSRLSTQIIVTNNYL